MSATGTGRARLKAGAAPATMPGMHAMLRDLVSHKGHANAAMLAAIRPCDAAATDGDVVALLHHILLANRFWLVTVLGQPFVLEEESRRSASFDDLVARYARLQAAEEAWLASAAGPELQRHLDHPQIPGGGCSVAQAYLQVCLHSHGHRAQLAKLLRTHGGTPPATDFILWLATRPAAEWPAAATA